jgi:hypothetical protein
LRVHGEGHDFIGEFPSLLRGFGLVLAGHGEAVLLLAADLPLLGNVFRGLAHVIAVERIPQPVLDHGIDKLHVAHFGARAQVRHMRAERHVLLSTCDHDGCIAQLDMLRAQRNRPQARTANLIDAPCRRLPAGLP